MSKQGSAWLYLALTPGLGIRRSLQLVQAFGSASKAVTASYRSLTALIGHELASALSSKIAEPSVNQALAWASLPRRHLLTLDDDDYPMQLAETSTPPIALFAQGRRELLSHPMLAMVGSRNATIQGKRTAREFASALARHGCTIVSGLACGIDTASHEGALEYPATSTVAVMGTGIDRVYPASNEALAHRLANEGLIVSEFSLGAPPLPAHFPQRNRIIAGLARGCLVVEAGTKSGSLITARYALEAGREVMAIPGSIHSPTARGCHHLIKNGARLVETVDDILNELALPSDNSYHPTKQQPANADPSPILHPLLDAMGGDPIDIERLSEQLKLTTGELYAMLLELELAGHVAALPGGRFQRLF